MSISYVPRPRPKALGFGDQHRTQRSAHGGYEVLCTRLRRYSWRAFILAACMPLCSCHPIIKSPPAAHKFGGPIHGYVAAVVSAGGAELAAEQRRRIYIPNVQVWAKSATTSVVSAKVSTNAAGYNVERATISGGRKKACSRCWTSCCNRTP